MATYQYQSSSQRATRPDKGRVILTARDWSGLRFAAEMYAVRLDHFGQLFAPDLAPAQQEERGGPAYPVGEKRQRLPWPQDPRKRLDNVYDIVRRWVKAGFARLEKPFAGEPMWCWITKEGLGELRLSYDAGFPARADLAHLHQVTRIRLLLARAAQIGTKLRDHPVQGHVWISERALAAVQKEWRAGVPLSHRPDGILHLHTGEEEAVEVEQTRKSYERLQQILEELTAPESRYRRVWYFVSDSATEALLEAHAQLDDDRAARVLIYRL